ncbi:hypothetical protein EV122DRAFT_224026 [Schizophyllum commune]
MAAYTPRYIPQHSLENLKKYSYKGVDKSLLSQYVLNPFWNWFVTLWPTSVAPNTITFSGLCLVGFNFLTMLYYDPQYLTMKEGGNVPPNWIYFTWAAGLFWYQAFDAIDGKQARRTGMAGPLGEMFDHGCDALNTTLEALLTCYALNLGRSWWTVASQIATLANFYLTTWEEYHTGQLYLGVFSGPVEGIIMIVFLYIITGFYGPTFWDTGILTIANLENVPPFDRIPNIGLNEAFMYFGAVGLAFNIFTSYGNVLKAVRHTNASRWRPMLYLMPFPVMAGVQVAWLASPAPADVLAASPDTTRSMIMHSHAFVAFILAFGLQFAHQVGRMILAHVTKGDFPWFDWMWAWTVLGALDANLPRLIGRAPLIQTTPERTAQFVYFTLTVSAALYARFVTLVIRDITNYLGIACFSVQRRDVDGAWHDARDVKAHEMKAAGVREATRKEPRAYEKEGKAPHVRDAKTVKRD